MPAQQRQKQRVVSQLEKELMEQARERGVNRHTARQTLFDKLTWRDGDTLVSTVVSGRFLLLQSKMLQF